MTPIQSLGTKIDINLVKTDDRVRKDFGDIDALANSIREHGLIQKIVLTYHLEPEEIRLLVGERRLQALKKLGLSHLLHHVHFYWNEELSEAQGRVEPEIELRRRGVELEENLRRKNLSWSEEVLAKQKLLDVMVSIHGTARPGQPSTMQRLGSSPVGFGVNKLAAMLGESNAATSKDLELARLITAVPQLASAETKEAARRQAVLATAVAISQINQAKSPPPKDAPLWTLYEGDFINNVNNILPQSVDLVLVDPPYGEDSQGMAANSRELLAKPFADGLASTKSVLMDMAVCSWRVLRDNSFCAFFFGFVVYADFVSYLRDTGFEVDLTPLIWVKNNVINTSPYTRFGRSYEPILIARKGSPKLFRPAQRDVISMDVVQVSGGDKYYHAQKPVPLLEKLILDLSPPGGTVVDFCCGSGTTGVAATRLKRRSYLFERDPIACKIARTRLGTI